MGMFSYPSYRMIIPPQYFVCNLGSGLPKIANKLICVNHSDIDECSQGIICPLPGTCVNTLGSYRCSCPRGFKLDAAGTQCVTVADCPNGNCDKNVQCEVRSSDLSYCSM